jgi:hypothetical protein
MADTEMLVEGVEPEYREEDVDTVTGSTTFALPLFGSRISTFALVVKAIALAAVLASLAAVACSIQGAMAGTEIVRLPVAVDDDEVFVELAIG